MPGDSDPVLVAERDHLQGSREFLRLMRENVLSLRALGVEVAGRVPIVVSPNPFSAGYLEAKRLRMAHELPRHAAHAGSELPRAAAVNGDAE